jgi:biopolymer transport protein ExbD
MAIQVGGAGSGRRSRGAAPLAEINVTPFVDVALVLLIIFMITAHVMEYGIEIDVPKTTTVASTTKEYPVVQLSKTGDLYLGKDPVRLALLPQTIRSKYAGQDSVFVRADAQTTYDALAQVLAALGAAKLKVNLVTQPDNAGSHTGGKR